MDNIPMFSVGMKKEDVRQMSPLVLAFIGDGVHTLYVRTRLATTSDSKTGELHRLASSEVSAVHQSEMAGRIVEVLSEDETDIFKRARNSKTHSAAKNAAIMEYRRATGVEAVFGYLYLTGSHERLAELLMMFETSEKAQEQA